MSNYWKYLIKKQKSLLAIYTVICFMLLLFPLLPHLMRAHEVFLSITEANSEVGHMMQKMVIVLVPLMIVLPIFNYRFMLNKKMVDVYLTLPIQRKKLFRSHYLTTILMAIIPMLVIVFLSLIVLMSASNQGIYAFMRWSKWVIFMTVACLFLYALITLVTMKTNNVVDASIIAVNIAILPQVVLSACDSFIRNQTFIYDLPIFDWTERILALFSPILTILKINQQYMNNLSLNSEIRLFALYSLGMVIVLSVLAEKAFEKKKGEDAEQITTHWCTYPLVVNVLSICLISFVDFNSDAIFAFVLLTIIFIIYMIINFIASKSVRFTPRLFIKFIALILLFNGFSYISRKTEFFGLNRRQIDLNQVRSIEVYTNATLDQETGNWAEYYVYIQNLDNQEEVVNLLQDFQLMQSAMYKSNSEIKYEGTNVRITYRMKDGSRENREYNYFTLSEIQPLLNISEKINGLEDSSI